MKNLIVSFTLVSLGLMLVAAHAQIPTNGLVAYYPFSGNANDQSGNGRNGTVNGATLTTDRFGNGNSAYEFDGDSIVYPGLPVNLNGSYTVSAWLNLHVYQDGSVLFELSDGSVCSGNPVLFEINSNVDVNHCGGGVPDILFDSAQSLTGKWQHFLMTVNGSATKLYRNGVLISSTSQIWPVTASITLTLGAVRNGIGQFSKCALDDIRVYNRVLSSDEVAQLYSAEAPVVPLTSGLIAHYPFKGNANDESGNGNNGAVQNAALAPNRFGTPNSAFSFNGQNAQIVVNDNLALRGLASNYTFNVWADFAAFPGHDQMLLCKSFGPNNQKKWIFWHHVNPPVGIGFLIDRVTNNGMWSFNYPFTINNWHMLTFSASGNNSSIAVDGQVVSVQAGNFSLPDTTGVNLLIGGSEPNSGSFWFNGSLDDIRIYNRALSSNEIAQLYALESQPSCEDTVSLLQDQVAGLQSDLAATNDLVATLRAYVAGLQSDLAASNESVSNLQTQVSGLQTQLATSNSQVQALQTELTAVNLPIQRLTTEFQITFKKPQFQIPGATTSAKVNSIVLSIEKLTKGQQQPVYNNLGGK